MVTATRTTDDKARISLPGSFANCTVLMEQVSDTEVRIRKARVIPEDELPFVEESMTPLSDRDRDLFLALLDNPPPPNEALKRLMEEERPREPSNKEVVYKAWKKGISNVEQLHKMVNGKVKEDTIKRWLSWWAKGKELPGCAKNE